MNIIRKSCYEIFEKENGILTIKKKGKEFLNLPASCSINDEYTNMSLYSFSDKEIVYKSETEKMVFRMFDDCITVKFEKEYSKDANIFISKIFAGKDMGIDLVGFDRAFTPQARNNLGKNLDYYHHLPDISQNGYFTSAVLEISIGSPMGWVSLGLLDLPDSKIIKMDDDFSFLVESCGGNKKIPAGKSYSMPEIIITFPDDEWDAIKLFRHKLIEFGRYTPSKPKYSELPSWWKNSFVCTYGDQMLDNMVGYDIDEKYVLDVVERAEKDWGMDKFNLIIDDSWQYPLTPIVDEKRFLDFRGFIDRMHDRGHHVILWHAFALDRIANGFETMAQKLGCLTKETYGGYPNLSDTYIVDYTSDNAREYLRQVCNLLFGNKEGQYNADGVKIDFLACFRDPASTTYQNPERGMGTKEMLLFFEMFYEEAKKVKPDVIIDHSATDPRFEHTLDFNRMHDTHSGNMEKDIRAKISTLACPDLPIDSDGAIMLNRWLKVHYLNSVLYGVPSNYYTKEYHDGVISTVDVWNAIEGVPSSRAILLDEEKKKLGNLFKMAKFRPDGIPVIDKNDNWTLYDGDTVNAFVKRGETVIFYPTDKNDTGYIYTFQDEAIALPLHGRKISQITPAPTDGRVVIDYARDTVILKLKTGIVHTFKNKDNGDSIDNLFKRNVRRNNVETVMNYVNG